MNKRAVVVALCFILIAIPYAVQAHMFWLNVSDYTPEAGEPVFLEIGFGHQYPRDEIIKEGRVERVFAVDNYGKEFAVEQIFPSFCKFMPPGEGVYQIIAVMKSGFVSKTTDGRKLGSKKDHANAVDCFAFRMTATALISVGTSPAVFSGKGRNVLEVIPLKNPAVLKAGDSMAVKVSFQGKPLTGAKVQVAKAEHASRAEHGPGGHAPGMHQHWAQEEETNGNGVAVVKLPPEEPCLFMVNHESPYEDQSECDRYSYRTSLTVGF